MRTISPQVIARYEEIEARLAEASPHLGEGGTLQQDIRWLMDQLRDAWSAMLTRTPESGQTARPEPEPSGGTEPVATVEARGYTFIRAFWARPSYTPGKKKYYHSPRIGAGSKYSISYHDGVKTHKDGSEFYDIRFFKNKPDRDAFEQGLLKDGYVERSSIPGMRQ